MANDRDIDLTLTARDDASDAIDDVAKRIDQLPDEASVEVEAETRTAETAIQRFEREVDDLTDDGRELRIEFRAQTLQREIRNTLRELERLDDPVEIEARTADLERAQKDMRDLAELADRKYEIDIDADPRRTAQRAGDDLDVMRQRGEGMQSAIPAIRGFGDELGGTAQSAGVASQAVADLGDFALIAGERFTKSGSRMSGIATKLGTVLGSAGLAGAFAGIAIQLGQSAIPKLQEWLGETEEATRTQEELTEAIEGTADALAAGKMRDAVDAFIENNTDMIDTAAQMGIGVEDLTRYVFDLSDSLIEGRRGFDVQRDGYEALRGEAADLSYELRTQTEQLLDNADATATVGDELAGTVDVLNLGITATDDATDATESNTVAVADNRAELEELVGRLTAVADTLNEQVTAQRAAADAQFALNDATADLTDTLAAGQETLSDSESTLVDVRAAMDDAAESAGAVADAEVRIAEETAAANGETLSATARQDRWNDSMIGSAATAKGPLRDSILTYIAAVNGIPEEELTDIRALIDEGKLDEAEKALNDASRTRATTVVADAATGQAETELDNLARDRTATIYGDVTIRRNVRYDQASGTFVPTGRSGPAPAALGDPLAGVSPAARGAAGRSGAYMSTSDPFGTVSVGATIAPPTVNNVTVNLPPGSDARDVVRAVNRWTRINGRA